MKINSLKINLDGIQNFLNYCVLHAYNILIDNIQRKVSCIDNVQLKVILQNEYINITDKLSSMYLNYPALTCVEKYYNESHFLWESTFFESITKEQKLKYSKFNTSILEYSKFVENHTIYDNDLPMFSLLVDAIVFERYNNYLHSEIKQISFVEINIPQSSHKVSNYDELDQQKKKQIIGEKLNPFKSNFSAEQIELLTDCINEVKLFTTTVSSQIVADLFSCNLKGVLKSNNNRQLAYLMQCLNLKGFITNEWQAAISRNKLILGKTKDTPLTSTDLSTATDQINMKQPKGYEIIDNYIKHLKKD